MKAMDIVLSELLLTKFHNMRKRWRSNKPAETVLKHIWGSRVDRKLLNFFAT